MDKTMNQFRIGEKVRCVKEYLGNSTHKLYKGKNYYISSGLPNDVYVTVKGDNWDWYCARFEKISTKNRNIA